jgi:recombinational DNA repair protein (RecF pathway)
MSYHVYTTRGLVLSERSVREADRIYTILTRDLGLLHATALGVRKEPSKLRGNIEPLSLSSISFVRGKEYWRITSAEMIKKIPAYLAISRPLVLIEKLVQGEAPNPELFDAVEEASLFCPERGQEVFELHDEMFEVRLVSQILLHLGYLERDSLDLDKKSLIKLINEGIQASHL